MFDIGFWELTLIAIIALLVIGPDRLPEVARTTGLWIRKARQFISGVKGDIEREFRAEELKRILKEQEEFQSVHEIIEETKTTVTDVTSQLSSLDSPIEDAGDSTKSSPNKPSEKANPGNTGNSHAPGDTNDGKG
uniref:Sec-independent protein translocase protein TatB n=1 Tax=Candidatus Kentrum sp. MB TaxID=2138164 RepID=A0A450XI66_9GAMM|nr:MAG: sec-independent protein translocase protein TatB [Candidatus Kentron sp. MB]VFK34062.1 MAG: sec-independent protein translocase protein TatB [Candidatus Kentron sp. MB]VFK76564.1 MAG: sec-independent protein translocase protein TatB [Candidatus Kentron sp. MB]